MDGCWNSVFRFGWQDVFTPVPGAREPILTRVDPYKKYCETVRGGLELSQACGGPEEAMLREVCSQ